MLRALGQIQFCSSLRLNDLNYTMGSRIRTLDAPYMVEGGIYTHQTWGEKVDDEY
jgi:hypothetical protein